MLLRLASLMEHQCVLEKTSSSHIIISAVARWWFCMYFDVSCCFFSVPHDSKRRRERKRKCNRIYVIVVVYFTHLSMCMRLWCTLSFQEMTLQLKNRLLGIYMALDFISMCCHFSKKKMLDNVIRLRRTEKKERWRDKVSDGIYQSSMMMPMLTMLLLMLLVIM